MIRPEGPAYVPCPICGQQVHEGDMEREELLPIVAAGPQMPISVDWGEPIWTATKPCGHKWKGIGHFDFNKLTVTWSDVRRVA